MNCRICLTCGYSDTLRTNDLGEIRCKKFSTFVKPSESCSCYCDQLLCELKVKLKRGDNNDR